MLMSADINVFAVDVKSTQEVVRIRDRVCSERGAVVTAQIMVGYEPNIVLLINFYIGNCVLCEGCVRRVE